MRQAPDELAADPAGLGEQPLDLLDLIHVHIMLLHFADLYRYPICFS